MKNKIGKVGEISWIVGNILCALGNCLTAKSLFGLAPIVAPAFIIQKELTFLTVGVCEYIIQGLLLLLCCLIIGKFKGKFFFTICNIIFYGACFDVWNLYILSWLDVSGSIAGRITVAAIGTLITGFAIALMVRTYIPPSVYEIFVKEIAESKKIDFSKIKLIFDTSMLALSIVLMFIILGRFDLSFIGPLTIISAFLNSVLIRFFGKIIDKFFEFTPAVPRLYKLLNPNGEN